MTHFNNSLHYTIEYLVKTGRIKHKKAKGRYRRALRFAPAKRSARAKRKTANILSTEKSTEIRQELLRKTELATHQYPISTLNRA